MHWFRHFIFVGIIVLVSVLGLTVGSSTAQGPGEGYFLEIDTEHAVLTSGGTIEFRTNPGAVIYHDGLFHMFRNSCCSLRLDLSETESGESGNLVPTIGYATSEDGFTWEKQGDEPVLRFDEIPYVGNGVQASSVLVEDDGTWVLYFHNLPSVDEENITGIGRATAPAPEGPWTPDPELVLKPGEPGEWDDTQLTTPSVVKSDSKYLMYYSVDMLPSPPDYHIRIGIAVSEDGITWEKYDNPNTTNAPFAHSDPVFEPSIGADLWDSDNVLQPNVIVDDQGLLVMMYKAHSGFDRREEGIGFAVSENGLTWTRLFFDPLFSTADIARRRIGFTEMIYHDGTYYVYLELQRGYQNDTDIYAGKVENLFGEG